MKYIFRGNLVFDYNPETKEVHAPGRSWGSNFNYCKFITEDYYLISSFFMNIYMYERGEIQLEDLKDIKVN